MSNLPIHKRKDLPKGHATRQQLADAIVIQIHEGSSKKQPTLVVRDQGVGLTPNLVPTTILSLNETNKVDKPYLAGAYGQGGSTALAFSPSGTLLVTRRQPDLRVPDEADSIAVTFVRYNELDPNHNKNGRYEYLVGPHGAVAGIPATTFDYAPGTTVVHFNYELPQYSARITQVTGSLWWLLQNSLFDPVLPFWIEERRPSMLEKNNREMDRRTIAGNFTRLMDDKKERVEHYDSIDVRVQQDGDSTVRVNYWVIKVNNENPGGQPIDAYVDPYRPISFTYNGQTHGTEERRFTAERLSLPYLSKFLIIQVELDHLTPQARRALMSTTRDRLKQLALYEDLREAIASALSQDEDLVRLNDERKERLLSKHSEAEQAKMRERFAKLLERFRAGIDIVTSGKGSELQGRKREGGKSHEPLEPLPTGEKPTFIRIANIQKPIPVRLDRHTLIRIESDAPDDYLQSHVHARLTLACEPEQLVVQESRSDFRGGRSRLTIRPTERAHAGQTGSLTIFLLTPEERTFSAKVGFRIEKPEDQPTAGSGSRAKVQVPAPIPVTKDEWAEHGWTADSVAEVKDDGNDTKIFVNIDNKHLAKLLASGGYQETGLKRMRNNFLLYVAFYAWMRFISLSGRDLNIEGKDFEDYQASELDRMAQTVVHSISAASRLEEED